MWNILLANISAHRVVFRTQQPCSRVGSTRIETDKKSATKWLSVPCHLTNFQYTYSVCRSIDKTLALERDIGSFNVQECILCILQWCRYNNSSELDFKCLQTWSTYKPYISGMVAGESFLSSVSHWQIFEQHPKPSAAYVADQHVSVQLSCCQVNDFFSWSVCSAMIISG